MRILHAADLHLDSAFAALSADKARQRRRESRDILNTLAQLARREQVDLVLLSGDLFDGEHVYPETIEQMKSAFAKMTCPVFISPGNHDPYTARSPYTTEDWPENVHIFRAEELMAVAIPRLRCVVHGAAFTQQHRETEALDGISIPDDGQVHLLCLHGAVNEPGSEYGNISREQIARSGFDYLALGHIHQYSGAQKEGKSVWVYPGCPEGRGFDETGDKGAVLVDVENGAVEVRFVALCRRRYRILNVDVTDSAPMDALERVMPETAADDICRVIFTGEVGGQGIDLRALEDDLAHRFYALEVRDETRVAQDIWYGAGEDSLRGLFLADLRARYDTAKDETEKERIISAVRFGLAAMDGRDIG